MDDPTRQTSSTPSVPIPPPLLRADLESVAQKLDRFVEELTPGECGVVQWVMLRAAEHGEANKVVVGGADGILVLFGPRGFTVPGPEGPLPIDLGRFVGATLLRPGR